MTITVAAPTLDLPSLRFRDLTPGQVADLRDWWMDAVREGLPTCAGIEKEFASRAEAEFHELPADGSGSDVRYAICFDAVTRVIVLVDLSDVSRAMLLVLSADCRSHWRMNLTSYEDEGKSAHERTSFDCHMTMDQAASPEAWQEYFGDLFCRADDCKVQVVMPGE